MDMHVKQSHPRPQSYDDQKYVGHLCQQTSGPCFMLHWLNLAKMVVQVCLDAEDVLVRYQRAGIRLAREHLRDFKQSLQAD